MIKGIIPPLLSPLKQDGTIDNNGVASMVQHCLEGKVDGIFVLGSCGEGSVLGATERFNMVSAAMTAVNRRIPLLAGVLETSAGKVITEIRELEKLDIEYFVVPLPYYLPAAGQEQMVEYFRYISERIQGKLIIYNIPAYVHDSIAPETMMELLHIPKVISIKDSTGDWSSQQKALLLKREREEKTDKSLLCGNEELACAAFLLGANGLVPCFANIYPGFFASMWRAAEGKDWDLLVESQIVIKDLKELLSVGGSWIAVLKYICFLKGLIQPYPGGVQSYLTEMEKEKIKERVAIIQCKHAGLR